MKHLVHDGGFEIEGPGVDGVAQIPGVAKIDGQLAVCADAVSVDRTVGENFLADDSLQVAAEAGSHCEVAAGVGERLVTAVVERLGADLDGGVMIEPASQGGGGVFQGGPALGTHQGTVEAVRFGAVVEEKADGSWSGENERGAPDDEKKCKATSPRCRARASARKRPGKGEIHEGRMVQGQRKFRRQQISYL